MFTLTIDVLISDVDQRATIGRPARCSIRINFPKGANKICSIFDEIFLQEKAHFDERRNIFLEIRPIDCQRNNSAKNFVFAIVEKTSFMIVN